MQWERGSLVSSLIDTAMSPSPQLRLLMLTVSMFYSSKQSSQIEDLLLASTESTAAISHQLMTQDWHSTSEDAYLHCATNLALRSVYWWWMRICLQFTARKPPASCSHVRHTLANMRISSQCRECEHLSILIGLR